MTIHSLLTLTCLFSLLLSSVIQARTFRNTEGKSIEAELISVQNDTAVMKLTNGRVVKVAINKLSIADQDHIKAWWKDNKNSLSSRDVTFSMRRKSAYSKRPTTKVSKQGKIKTSEMEFTYLCRLDNSSAKTVSGIKATYSVHKRISKRGKGGSSSDINIITNTMQLDLLESHKHLNFTTDGIKCSNLSNTAADLSVREMIVGMVITLSINGKEILTRSHPENFARLVAENEKRAESKEVARDKRAESKDIADGKRDDSNQSKGDGDRDRNDRLSQQKKDREERLRKEKEARKKKQEDYKNRIR